MIHTDLFNNYNIVKYQLFYLKTKKTSWKFYRRQTFYAYWMKYGTCMHIAVACIFIYNIFPAFHQWRVCDTLIFFCKAPFVDKFIANVDNILSRRRHFRFIYTPFCVCVCVKVQGTLSLSSNIIYILSFQKGLSLIVASAHGFSLIQDHTHDCTAATFFFFIQHQWSHAAIEKYIPINRVLFSFKNNRDK